MTERSNLREVRNPVLALPAARKIMALSPEVRAVLAELFGELAADCRDRAEKCWRTHKPPMAAYWKACAVVAGHVRKVLRRGVPADQAQLDLAA
jgi:hypothetical protein